MGKVVIWWIHNWSALESALQEFPPDDVNPADYLETNAEALHCLTEEEMFAEMTESLATIFEVRTGFERIIRTCAPEITQLIQKVFITPFSEGIHDLPVADNMSRNWDFVWSSISPNTVQHLYHLSHSN